MLAEWLGYRAVRPGEPRAVVKVERKLVPRVVLEVVPAQARQAPVQVQPVQGHPAAALRPARRAVVPAARVAQTVG